jgi:hypothetical protein
MEMRADPETVAAYLDRHEGWFRRCAEPMQVTSIGENAYALSLGRYGSLGWELEPRLGLELLPQDEGCYRIRTVPIPNLPPEPYQVDFQAVLVLACETPPEDGLCAVTLVQWDLDLSVTLALPRWLQGLPENLVRASGETLLLQIVRQISRRLTRKVQQDFHSSHNLPMPKPHQVGF